MDKYIKMLLIKLSGKYKTTIITIMSYNNEKGTINNVFKFSLYDKAINEPITQKDFYNKRELVSEMVKWLN